LKGPQSQENRKNPYYPAFDLLLAKFLAVDQALNVAEAAFGYATESPDAWLGQISDKPLSHMLADICDDRNPGYVKLIPSVRVPDRETELLLRTVRDFRTQSYLWVIARGFEAFREFVQSVEAELRDSVGVSAGYGRKPITDTAHHRESRFTQALKRIREAAPPLVACEKSNARKIQLQQWVAVAEAVRNAVAHNEGILRKADYERYCSSGLEEHFPGELEEDTGYVLKPTPESTAKTIRTFREYGVAVYKAISEAHGFPAALLGPDGEITTWRR